MIMKRCKKAYLYLIKFEHGCKIGMTIDWEQRMREYNKPWCHKILAIQRWSGFAFLKQAESSINNMFKKYTKEGSTEFFHGVHFDVVSQYVDYIKKCDKRYVKDIHINAYYGKEMRRTKLKGYKR